MSGDDYGIHIGGEANISGSQIASGQHVRQTQQAGEALPAPVAESLTRVARLLDEHAEVLDEHARALRDLEEIQRELTEADPDPERVRHALDRLGTRVATVAVLVEAVQTLGSKLGF